MPSNKKYLIYLSICFLFLIFLSNSTININQNDKNRNYSPPSDEIDDNDILNKYEPEISDGTSSYTYNEYDLILEDFNLNGDINDWTVSGDASVSTGPTENRLTFVAGPAIGTESAQAIYNQEINRFWNGNLEFYYEVAYGFGISPYVRIALDIYDGSWNNDVLAYSGGSAGPTFVSFSLDSYDTTYHNFTIRWDFTGRNNDDYAYIEDMKIVTNEFEWDEQAGDPIEETTDQTIRAFFVPTFANFDRTNVTIKYKLNDPALSNPTIDTMNDNGVTNRFTYDFSQSLYDSSDRIYYQIWINNDLNSIHHSTPIYSFDCYDRTNPTITYQGHNATTYHNDVLIRCHIVDDQYGDGLDLVRLYIKNGSAADTGDTLIAHNFTGDIKDGGNFGFLIDSSHLSARAGEDLHFRIYARDGNNNEEVSVDLSLSLLDDVVPDVAFNDDNAYPAPNQIECTRSLKVNYSITEPLAGSGLKSLELLVWIHENAPTSNDDYNFTVNANEGITINGGIFNFIIDSGNYRYGKKVFCFINATDLSGNNYTQFSNYIEYDIVDLTAPSIVHDQNNENPHSYHLNSITLNFTLSEPSAGAGILNSTKLYYKLNDPSLTNPTIIEVNVLRYGQTVGYIIPNLDWQYGDIVYYKINVTDIENHQNVSEIKSFTITDKIKPHYSEKEKNTNGWVYNNYKLLNFTIWDPDYDGAIHNSSGIKNITLFWRAGQAPDMETKVFDGMLTYTGVISKTTNLYSFNLSLTSLMYKNGPDIYYVINVSDVAGSFNISTTQSFRLYSNPYIPNTISQPASVISSSKFSISFDLNFFCNVYYYIDAPNNFQENNLYIHKFSKDFDLAEGDHIIVFEFNGTGYKYSVNVEIDLTPPDKIENIGFQIFGYEVVEVSWEIPQGADEGTFYRIYRSTDSTFDLNKDNLIAETEPGEDSFEDTDIKEGDTYYYIIVAIDRVGNISEKSEVVKVEVLSNPTVMIIVIVAICSSLGIAGYMIHKKIIASKRERLFSKVDLKELDIADEELSAKSAPEWKEIKTTVEPKIIQEEGFEFTSDQPLEPLFGGGYWDRSIGLLFSKSIEFELTNELGNALKGYKILSRLAKIQENSLLEQHLKSKIQAIYYRLNS
ncbi:MAG: hypothetical protein ACTSR8_01610 [Promethearchaeota archaeon]